MFSGSSSWVTVEPNGRDLQSSSSETSPRLSGRSSASESKSSISESHSIFSNSLDI